MGQEVSQQEASRHKEPVSQHNQHNQHLKPVPKNPEHTLTTFPQRHSCQHCQEDVINAFNANSSNPTLLRNRGDAVEAANDGCALYEWLLFFFFRSQAPPDHGFYLQLWSFKDPRDIASVQFLIGTPNYTWPCAAFEVFAEADNPSASFISTRPFNADVSSSATFDVIKRWLADCCENHKKCQSPIRGFLPTRLIDVSKANTKVVKIVSDHKNIPASEAAYATLSYCWGGDQLVKTTKATLAQHQASIMTSNLGQTLQDAIKVAHSLGLRFLWVDSLCIIQDDPKDIALEISKMSAYYENGYVSICASAAAGSNEGFLERRKHNPYRYGPFELPYRGPDNRLGCIKLIQYLDYSKAMEPVSTRAWIMQESLLAPRVLSYSYQSVAWSCRRTSNSDGGPSPVWYDFQDRVIWANLQHENNFQVCILKWNRLVESYTSRSLSDPKDRLPAISGIAQKYAKLLQKSLLAHWHPHLSALDGLNGEDTWSVNYVAGLWYCKPNPLAAPVMFSQQLLWSTSYYMVHYPSTKQEHGSIPDALLASAPEASRISTVSNSATRVLRFLGSRSDHTYLAPSWSWASIKRPISFENPFGYFPRAPGFEFLYCDTDLEIFEAPYGNITSGRLSVWGILIPVLHFTQPHFISGHYVLTIRPDKEESAAFLAKIMEGKQKGWVLPVTDMGSLTRSSKPKDPSWTETAPKGIILVAEGGCYRRIGLCSIEPHLPGDSRLTKIKAVLEAYGKQAISII